VKKWPSAKGLSVSHTSSSFLVEGKQIFKFPSKGLKSRRPCENATKCNKCWSTWFDAVLHYTEFFFEFEEFVQRELKCCKQSEMLQKCCKQFLVMVRGNISG